MIIAQQGSTAIPSMPVWNVRKIASEAVTSARLKYKLASNVQMILISNWWAQPRNALPRPTVYLSKPIYVSYALKIKIAPQEPTVTLYSWSVLSARERVNSPQALGAIQPLILAHNPALRIVIVPTMELKIPCKKKKN